MKLEPKHFLKWLDTSQPALQNLDATLVRQGMVSAHDAKGACTAFTVFTPRDFNEAFIERLAHRLKKEAASLKKLRLYLPDFLRHRVQSLLKEPLKSQIEVRYTSYLRLENVAQKMNIRDRLRVLNVDDSPVLLKLLKHLLEDTGYVDVMHQVSDAKSAVEKILRFRPDLVTLDIQMPGKTGVEVLKDLLAQSFFPVIMISSLNLEEGSLVFDALNHGAFDYLQKPSAEDKKQFAEELENKVLVAVERARANSAPKPITMTRPTLPATAANFVVSPDLLWCIGASTGGTQALTRVFTSLPHLIPPTLVVQHIPPVFSKAFAESLNALCPFTVKEAEDGEVAQNNHVYVAPGGLQMGVELKGTKLCITLADSEPVNRFKPSVDYLFKKVADLKKYRVVAGILTGMGRDGAEGLLRLKENGAHTFAQDEASCAVYGMPRAAVELGAAEEICPLDGIAQTLLRLSQSKLKRAS